MKDGIVSVGLDDGGIDEVRIDDLNFQPKIGDVVDIYRTETKTIVTKKEKEKQVETEGGIHINVSNKNESPVQQVVYGKKVVNKLTYCLLAGLLGGLGIHKFYSGRIGMGIVYILFCWTAIPSVIGLIECIIGAVRPADANGNILI